jgi:diguanylate cyclase (GGDEF)-like protein
MRGNPVALFSGIGRRAAMAVIIGGMVVLACSLLLQAGKQHRQYRAMHQQQLRQAAAQFALVDFRQLEASAVSGTIASAGQHAELLVVDANGRQLFSTLKRSSDVVNLVKRQLGQHPVGTVVDMAWTERDMTWVGAMAVARARGAGNRQPVAVVALDADRPWSVAFWSALRTQSAIVPLLLVLAALLAHRFAGANAQTFRQLRRALAQLPERHVTVAPHPALARDVRQLVDAYNRSAAELEAQAEVHKAIEDIDGLLLAGGDHENVIDQVLTRVRGVTGSNNVGLTLIEPGVSGHGRMFLVNADGGCPVNRVVLDEQMLDTLRNARSGLTVVRCEERRHSFLEPLQRAGSGFFWIWPVTVEGALAAILSVGYVEPPANGARVAGCGTHCAQRLGIALTGNANAERLYRQAHFDPLTQLPNRLLFRDQLGQELQMTAANGGSGALFYIDLDHFKKINDSLGHSAGDQVLSIVAQRLRACVKDGDTVARLGGDEFTVILRDVADTSAVAAVAERMIQSMQLPMRIGDGEHRVYASIGVAMFPDDGAGLDELVRCADLAMYCAKDTGRGAAVFYNPRMADRGAKVIDSGIYRAVTRREFSLYYQPQYDVRDGSMTGAEALLRWNRSRDGMMSPDQFIPAAEEAGLIVDLGGWVIDTVCAQVAQWRSQGHSPPRVAVNISSQQLRDPLLVEGLRRTLERHRLRPDAIEFEMSEAALTDPENKAGVEALAALGISLTLDDFGTGNTALSNLRRYPVSAVKIDRSFIEELSQVQGAETLASTIIVMAHSQGKRVIAEGVESIDQFEYLRERGCDGAQGFFMAEPLTVADMTDLLAGRTAEITGKHSALA